MEEDLFQSLGGSLMKDLLADLQGDDGEGDGWLSLEQLEKELSQLDDKPALGVAPPQSSQLASLPLPPVPPPSTSAASMVVTGQQQFLQQQQQQQQQQQPIQGVGLLGAVTVTKQAPADAWKESLQKFTALSLDQDFLAADTVRKQQKSNQTTTTTPQLPPGFMAEAEEYDATEKVTIKPPPGLLGSTGSSTSGPPPGIKQNNSNKQPPPPGMMSADQATKKPSLPPPSSSAVVDEDKERQEKALLAATALLPQQQQQQQQQKKKSSRGGGTAPPKTPRNSVIVKSTQEASKVATAAATATDDEDDDIPMMGKVTILQKDKQEDDQKQQHPKILPKTPRNSVAVQSQEGAAATAVGMGMPPTPQQQVGMPPPPPQQQQPGMMMPPGQMRPPMPGMPPQGMMPGMPPHGLMPGMPPGGMPPPPHGMPLLQGMPPPQGMPPQGMPPQGMPPQGMPPQGMPPQGMPPQGMPPQGMPPQGMPPQGMIPPPGGPGGPRPPMMVPPVGGAVPVAMPTTGGPAWQTGPRPPPPPPPPPPMRVFCNPHPNAPPIPAQALESKMMKSRDITYIVHSIMKPVLMAGFSEHDYDIQLLHRQSGGRPAGPRPLMMRRGGGGGKQPTNNTNNNNKKKNNANGGNNNDDPAEDDGGDVDIIQKEMESREKKSKEWSTKNAALGHIAKANVARPRALIASPALSQSNQDKPENASEQKQRARLWKARIYCDQAYQAYLAVVDIWAKATPGSVPPGVHSPLIRLMKCLGIAPVSTPSTSEGGGGGSAAAPPPATTSGGGGDFQVDPSVLQLFLKLSKGRILFARIIEQALLPPSAVQAVLPATLDILYKTPLPSASSNNENNQSGGDLTDDRCFRALTVVVQTLPALSGESMLKCAETMKAHSEAALSSTSRMECLHALLQRGSGLAASNDPALGEYPGKWKEQEDSFMAILSGM